MYKINEQINKAKKEMKRMKRRLRTKKRFTSLARIENGWLKVIKSDANDKKMTISKCLDEIILNYYGKRKYQKI